MYILSVYEHLESTGVLALIGLTWNYLHTANVVWLVVSASQVSIVCLPKNERRRWHIFSYHPCIMDRWTPYMCTPRSRWFVLPLLLLAGARYSYPDPQTNDCPMERGCKRWLQWNICQFSHIHSGWELRSAITRGDVRKWWIQPETAVIIADWVDSAAHVHQRIWRVENAPFNGALLFYQW